MKWNLSQVKELVPQAVSGIYELADVCDNFAASFRISSSHMLASCDMKTDGGKWMVIQKRFNNSVDFYRNWTDYVNGFGDLEGEFWYGLEKIHCLTTREDVELRIELGNETTPSIVWTYQLFRVGGAETNYRLTIGQGQGQGGTYDAMAQSNGAAFSTPDRDNDDRSGGTSCTVQRQGAWWYKACSDSNLNGKYDYNTFAAGQLSWSTHDRGTPQHYTKVVMKVSPKRSAVAAGLLRKKTLVGALPLNINRVESGRQKGSLSHELYMKRCACCSDQQRYCYIDDIVTNYCHSLNYT